MADYKITTEANPSEHAVTLLFNGKLSEDSLTELERLLSVARGMQPRIYLDLSEVTLVDRKAADYLAHKIENAYVINCPAYLERWILNGK